MEEKQHKILVNVRNDRIIQSNLSPSH